MNEIGIFEALAALAGLGFLAQAGYYLGLYRSLYTHQTDGLSADTPPLSVIVVAKEKTPLLQAHLETILSQDYPRFEVIVVHDQAASDCDDLLKQMEAQHAHLYHTFIPSSARYISHKKLGIAMGIKAAHYDIFVMTEPDSAPLSPQWLRSIAGHFTPHTDIVLGYSNYLPQHNWTVRRAIYDRMIQSMRYLGMAILGHPYSASGRNMAYRRSLYTEQHGFTAHLELKRGEDDLFVNQSANRYNTRVMTQPESLVGIDAPTYHTWKEEKISYMATGRFYQGLPRLIADSETAWRLLFLLANTALWVMGWVTLQPLWIALPVALWLLRWLMQIGVMRGMGKAFKGPKYVWLIPWMDLLQPLWNLNFKVRQILRHKEDFLRK
jgi:hypothetical protein